MGSFIGHVIPATVLLVLASQWAYKTLLRYYLCRRDAALDHRGARRFQSSLWYPTTCCPNFPFELVLWTVLVFAEFMVEVAGIPVLGFLMNAQHASILSGFLLAPIIMLLRHYNVPLVPDLEYGALSLSFVIEAFLLNRHARFGSKSPLETQMHVDLCYLAVATAFSVLAEMQYRNSCFASLAKSYLLTCKSVWFLINGFALFNPFGEPFDGKSEWMLQFCSMAFVWTLLGCLVLFLCLNIFVARQVSSMGFQEVKDALQHHQLPPARHSALPYLESPSPGKIRPEYSVLLNTDDDDA